MKQYETHDAGGTVLHKSVFMVKILELRHHSNVRRCSLLLWSIAKNHAIIYKYFTNI